MTSEETEATGPRTMADVIEAIGAVEQPRFQYPTIDLQLTAHAMRQNIFAAARRHDWPTVRRLFVEYRAWRQQQRAAAEEYWVNIRAEASKPDPCIFPARLMDPPDGVGVGDYLSGRMYDVEEKEPEGK